MEEGVSKPLRDSHKHHTMYVGSVVCRAIIADGDWDGQNKSLLCTSKILKLLLDGASLLKH